MKILAGFTIATGVLLISVVAISSLVPRKVNQHSAEPSELERTDYIFRYGTNTIIATHHAGNLWKLRIVTTEIP